MWAQLEMSVELGFGFYWVRVSFFFSSDLDARALIGQLAEMRNRWHLGGGKGTVWGFRNCSTCPYGRYSLERADSCVLCPEGTYSHDDARRERVPGVPGGAVLATRRRRHTRIKKKPKEPERSTREPYSARP